MRAQHAQQLHLGKKYWENQIPPRLQHLQHLQHQYHPLRLLLLLPQVLLLCHSAVVWRAAGEAPGAYYHVQQHKVGCWQAHQQPLQEVLQQVHLSTHSPMHSLMHSLMHSPMHCLLVGCDVVVQQQEMQGVVVSLAPHPWVWLTRFDHAAVCVVCAVQMAWQPCVGCACCQSWGVCGWVWSAAAGGGCCWGVCHWGWRWWVGW